MCGHWEPSNIIYYRHIDTYCICSSYFQNNIVTIPAGISGNNKQMCLLLLHRKRIIKGHTYTFPLMKLT